MQADVFDIVDILESRPALSLNKTICVTVILRGALTSTLQDELPCWSMKRETSGIITIG